MLPNNILVRILESLYGDFLESDECIDISKHHCSLLHPCISISKFTAFKPIYTFRFISSQWNKVFLSTARFDRLPFHRIVKGPYKRHTFIYNLLRKSVVLRRYRLFHNLDNDHDRRGVFVAYDFGVNGGCTESREVIIKAWMDNSDEDYETEKKVYSILSISPMKGCPSLIESTMDHIESTMDTDPNRTIYALVLEKLGPSLEDLFNLMTPNARFDEKMTLALAIQMLDRYAELHARKIIHNGVKPANICIASLSSNATDASTLYLIDFGYSFFRENIQLCHGEEFSGNKRFWSVLSYHAFAQSQRDDLESLGYLLSALFQGSLPWDSKPWDIWRVKMSTPGSTLFRDMDPSFLEYWKDVRCLAFNEMPDYCSLKSHFVKCWERKGFGGSPGEYDWLALFNKLNGIAQEKARILLPGNPPPDISPVSVQPSVIAPGNPH